MSSYSSNSSFNANIQKNNNNIKYSHNSSFGNESSYSNNKSNHNESKKEKNTKDQREQHQNHQNDFNKMIQKKHQEANKKHHEENKKHEETKIKEDSLTNQSSKNGNNVSNQNEVDVIIKKKEKIPSIVSIKKKEQNAGFFNFLSSQKYEEENEIVVAVSEESIIEFNENPISNRWILNHEKTNTNTNTENKITSNNTVGNTIENTIPFDPNKPNITSNSEVKKEFKKNFITSENDDFVEFQIEEDEYQDFLEKYITNEPTEVRVLITCRSQQDERKPSSTSIT